MPIQLPIDERIDDIVASLRIRPTLVLKAPPGTGKTTRVPAALLDHDLLLPGKLITVLEPRRLAARGAAARVAAERGGRPGEEIGYRVRFDAAVSSRTRLTFVTEGVLLRRLLADPLLEDTGAVILDEFHERSAEADLVLSLVRELRETVRPDLLLVVMSATLDPSPIARFLGDCPILESEGRVHEVRIEHAPRPATSPLEVLAVAAAARLFEEDPRGSVLVFLPGAAEIRRAWRRAEPLAAARDIELCALHGDLPSEEQDRAVRAGPRPRLIFSTNIAEASVTVEGITGVVDSGLARVLRRDPRTGLNRLATVRTSRSSATQRTGRAGRTAPGRCLRLYTAAEFAARPDFDEPEIRRIDLAELLLAELAWGARDPLVFPWLDPPEPESVRRALLLLRRLGAIAEDSPDDRPALTATGRAMLRLPVHPRLARILVESDRRSCRGEVSELVALLSERDIRLGARASLDPGEDGPEQGGFGSAGLGRDRAALQATSDLLVRRDELEEAARLGFASAALHTLGLDARAARRAWQAARQLRGRSAEARRPGGETRRTDSGARRPGPDGPRSGLDADLLRCLLAGYPDRVVRRRGAMGRDGVMVGGIGVRLDPASVVRGGDLFLALDAVPLAGGEGRFVLVRLASLVERAWLDELFPGSIVEEVDTSFDETTGRVVGRLRRLFLGLVLDDRETGTPDPLQAAALLGAAAAKTPSRAVALDPETTRWLTRLRWLLQHRPELAPAFDADPSGGVGNPSEPGSSAGPGDDVVVAAGPLFPWLLGCLRTLCEGKRSLAELRDAPLLATMRALLPGGAAAAMGRLAPERVTLPSGRAALLEYRLNDPPILAARLQEFFGSARAPAVADGAVPVLLHLLAPNHRPVQVTADLGSFWEGTYPKIRHELQRRYPRHAWPVDPLSAAPERGPRRRDGSAR